jgi:hypothetical protein
LIFYFSFIFLKVKKKINIYSKAWLQSMIFPVTSGRCLKFWYHMNGDGIGTLRVVIWYDNSQKEAIWQLSKEKGDKWYEGTVGFNSRNMTYKLV